MKKLVLDNGVRLLYKYREGNHSSFSIALEAGANSEGKDSIGVAHALEHIMFKGTENYNEDEINNKLDELFGFNNAMTNFPYVVYYGTTSNEDFYEGFKLYSALVLKPTLSDYGFEEEMNVIKQESAEWKEDLEQYCEDLLLFNGFPKERIKEIIIGEKHNLDKITLEHIQEFYKKVYVPNNIVVSVITSLDFEYVKDRINELFGGIEGNINALKEESHRKINSGTFIKEVEGNGGCKIAYGFDISKLSLRELTGLKLFNLWFGEGVSSILYDEIRTKAGLAYEVYSTVKGEKGIKIFKIGVSTSKESLERTLKIIDDCIVKAINIDKHINEDDIKKLNKRFKLKTSLDLERSIVLANRMAVYEVMYKDGGHVFNELNMVYDFTVGEVKKIANKVFSNAIIQVLV